MIDKALLNLCPNSTFSVEDNDYSTINWDVNNVDAKPTEAEIDAEVIRLQAEYDAQAYARNRQAEFPSIQDLVVALYDTDDKSAVEAKRAAVKTKYPKP